MASRIVVYLEEMCTPAQAGEFWNQVWAEVAVHSDAAPEIEVVVPHGILDRQPDHAEAARDAVREKFAPPRPVPPGEPVPGR